MFVVDCLVKQCTGAVNTGPAQPDAIAKLHAGFFAGSRLYLTMLLRSTDSLPRSEISLTGSRLRIRFFAGSASL